LDLPPAQAGIAAALSRSFTEQSVDTDEREAEFATLLAKLT